MKKFYMNLDDNKIRLIEIRLEELREAQAKGLFQSSSFMYSQICLHEKIVHEYYLGREIYLIGKR